MAKVLVTEDYLEDIADAIRAKLGGSTTYKPGQMAGAIALIQTGGGGGAPHITPQGATIDSVVGVNISSNTGDGYAVSISGNEYSAGYEGMNITLCDLETNAEYTVAFDFQSTDAQFFSGQYTLGYKISASRVTSYPTSQTPDGSYTAFSRDLTVNHCSTTFTATASTMYLIFAFVGYSDSYTNYFEITGLNVSEASA